MPEISKLLGFTSHRFGTANGTAGTVSAPTVPALENYNWLFHKPEERDTVLKKAV